MRSWKIRKGSHTLISLCSRNCKITFRRYSKLTSSSFVAREGVGAGEFVREGGSEELDDIDVRLSVGLWSTVRDVQYPTPGLRCRSSRAADDWTFLSSSRSV